MTFRNQPKLLQRGIVHRGIPRAVHPPTARLPRFRHLWSRSTSIQLRASNAAHARTSARSAPSTPSGTSRGKGEFLQVNAGYFATTPIEASSPQDPMRRPLPDDRPELAVAIVGTGSAACSAVAELSDIKGVTILVSIGYPRRLGWCVSGSARPRQHQAGNQKGRQWKGSRGWRSAEKDGCRRARHQPHSHYDELGNYSLTRKRGRHD